MENLPLILIGIVSIVIALIIIKKVTGIIFRVIILVVLAGFLYFLYTAGVHEMLLAPGSPGSEIILTIM